MLGLPRVKDVDLILCGLDLRVAAFGSFISFSLTLYANHRTDILPARSSNPVARPQAFLSTETR